MNGAVKSEISRVQEGAAGVRKCEAPDFHKKPLCSKKGHVEVTRLALHELAQAAEHNACLDCRYPTGVAAV